MKGEKSFSLGSSIKNKVREYEREEGIVDKVVLINTSDINNWEFRDRNAFELGSIEELAKDIEKNGQVQPILITRQNDVFKSEDLEKKYVVIAGYRRWLACCSLNINVACILKESITLENALATLVSENKKESISDYSKGIFFTNVLKKTTISQNCLASDLGLKPTTLKNFLSFSRIDDRIWIDIKNPSLISSRTASYLASTCSKGDKHVNALLKYTDKIESGIGATSLSKLVEAEIKGIKKVALKKPNIVFKSDIASIEQNGKQLTIKHINLNDDLILKIKELVKMHND